MKISLSILSIDYTKVEESLHKLLDKIDYLHLDIMDGEFVPNISYGPAFVRDLRKLTEKPFDTHLMLKHPQNYIKAFVDAGSQFITFHIEADCDAKSTIELIHRYNVKAGVAINPYTKLEEIIDLLPYLDLVLVMSVEPGFGGQKFMDIAVEKVKQLRLLKEQYRYSYLINVDGGITNLVAPKVKDFVDIAVTGSYVTGAENPLKNLELLRNI